MKKYATLKDVAALANSSLASVSAVLSESDKRYVSPELEKKILDAAKQLNYVKSYMASGLRGVSQKVIALLLPQFDNPFFTRLAVSVERAANENDYIIFVCDTKDEPKKERRIIETVIGHRVDGIILAPALGGAGSTTLIRKCNIPYIVVDRQLEGIDEPYDYVAIDNYQAGALSARKFIAHGHRRFGYVGWKSDISVIRQRQQGFMDTISANSSHFVYRLSEDLGHAQGLACTKELFESDKHLTAVLYGHHSFTPGGISFFRDMGIDIPRDVSVIQIGSPDWSSIVQPRITCVYQPIEEIGAIAAQMLFEKINGSRNIIETRLLQSSLIEGETVADVPGLQQKRKEKAV